MFLLLHQAGRNVDDPAQRDNYRVFVNSAQILTIMPNAPCTRLELVGADDYLHDTESFDEVAGLLAAAGLRVELHRL